MFPAQMNSVATLPCET